MNVLLWILQIILCVKFLSVAYTHAFRRDKAEMQQAMEKIGPIAPPLLILVDVGMFLGSLGLVLPAVSGSLAWLAPWAAMLLAALTLFSIGFHVFARKSPKVWVSLILFVLAAFVAYGRWVIEPLSPAAVQARDMALIAAADQGDLESARRLLEQGADVRASDARDRTALVAAAYRNDLEMAQLLIQAGADVNAKDDTQQSAYLIATSDGYLELLRLALQAGADVQSTDSFNGTGLIRAADRGHVEIIQELLKTDIRIDHINRLGWTALLEAIILGDGGKRYVEVVRLLVEAGADVNLADGNGVTPLAHAEQRGFSQIVEILREAGAR